MVKFVKALLESIWSDKAVTTDFIWSEIRPLSLIDIPRSELIGGFDPDPKIGKQS